MNTPKQEDKGFFVQYPLELIYGCPDLTRDDKWVLLAIMGECWSRGPHKLSYRDIAKLSGVPISLLSSTKGKNGKPDKEGIIDRLARLGKIKLDFGKEVVSGKPKGNAQTFIYVEYDQIWQDNVTYCEENRPNKTKEQYRCEKDNYQPVPNTNRLDHTEVVEPVRIANEPVPYTNKPVLHTNTSVPYTNEPVRDVSSKVPPYITDINITKDKEEESTANEILVVEPIAPNVALSPSFQSYLSLSSQEEKEEEKSPIVTATTRNDQSVEQNTLIAVDTSVPPVMPPETAKWCAETVVQIVEARLNKRFLEVVRSKSQKSQRERQLDAGKKIIAAKVTREEFISAYDNRNDQWWVERNGVLTVVEMAANTQNKVMRTLEVLETIEKKKPTGGRVIDISSRSSSEARPSFLVSDEAKQRHLKKFTSRC